MSLKRSQKTDFMSAGGPMVTRERSFVKPSKDAMKRRSQTMATIKGTPGGRLNVHAKEFTMNHHELQASKSSGNITIGFDGLPHLQHSKSSGSILRHLNAPLIPIISSPLPLPLLHSTSTSHILNMPRVTYQYGAGDILAAAAAANHPIFTGHNQPTAVQYNWNTSNSNATQNSNSSNNHQNSNSSLKRSKSLGSSDSHNLATKLKNLAKAEVEVDLTIFPTEEQSTLKIAMDDPSQLPSRTLMDLVKTILEKVVQGIRFSEAGAKICISIIEKEKNQTFLESLINTCQQWYQERDKILRGIKAGDGTRFTAFMWFLTEMCGQLKRHQIREQSETLQPDLVLLSVLGKCCQACVSLPIKCLSETECLFFVLTSIGRDLEAELPQQLEQLLANVRDGFLASAGAPAVRRTLLQLIELHASNWQLPGSSVLYYYPRIK